MKTLLATLTLAAGLLLAPSGAASAQSATASNTQPAAQPTYAVGDVHRESSRVYAFVDKGSMMGHTHAVTGGLRSGRLLLGASQNAGLIVIDMNSFEADTEQARRYVGLEGTTAEWMRKQVNEHMRGETGLDVGKYPTASFRVDSALPLSQRSANGYEQYELVGAFTLFGQTRPLKVVVETRIENGWRNVRGAFAVKHTDFGRKPYSKAFGAIKIADEVKIWGDLWVAPGVATASATQQQGARR